MHVLPRFAGDGCQITANWTSPPRHELDAVANQIREADTAGV
jgi:diadenosine tetraphosphate (Ap4A) HIT family hydrolase